MNHSAVDRKFMLAALAEARRALGQTSPNPVVGAVLVVGGKIVARGHHRGAGTPHAEVVCLDKLGGRAPVGATLYVTLEPCSTAGRTPACTDAIVAAGVGDVVFGSVDPNPIHQGRATDILAAAGISIRRGIMADECAALNAAFNKWVRTGVPYVILKCGMSLDGRLTRPPGESQWLTSPPARRHAHLTRATVDAILIGAETLRRDNPRLTVRGLPGARQPWRIVLSRSGKLPRHAHLFNDRHAGRTEVCKGKSLMDVLQELGKREVISVLIEGGGTILGEALDTQVADEIQIYLAPLFTGGPIFGFGGKVLGPRAKQCAYARQHTRE